MLLNMQEEQALSGSATTDFTLGRYDRAYDIGRERLVSSARCMVIMAIGGHLALVFNE